MSQFKSLRNEFKSDNDKDDQLIKEKEKFTHYHSTLRRLSKNIKINEGDGSP